MTDNKIWDAVGKWGKCSVWNTSLTKVAETFRPFHATLTRNDKVVSIANLYSGQEIVEDKGHYLIDAMSFYLLRDWSVRLLVPHVWFMAHYEEDADDSFALYHKAWPVQSGLRYDHTVRFGPPQLLIPKSDFKPCEVTI